MVTVPIRSRKAIEEKVDNPLKKLSEKIIFNTITMMIRWNTGFKYLLHSVLRNCFRFILKSCSVRLVLICHKLIKVHYLVKSTLLRITSITPSLSTFNFSKKSSLTFNPSLYFEDQTIISISNGIRSKPFSVRV